MQTSTTTTTNRPQITVPTLRDIIAREQSSTTTHVAPWIWMFVILVCIWFQKTTIAGMVIAMAVTVGSLIPIILAALAVAVWIKDKTTAGATRLAATFASRR